jgi:hypothetical protein
MEVTMGQCEYCGNDAGFFRKKHKDCEQRYQQGLRDIVSLAQESIFSTNELGDIDSEITSIMHRSYIKEHQRKPLLIQAWERKVFNALEEGAITLEQENALSAYMDHFSLSREDLEDNGAFSKLVKAAVLRDLLEGKMPERMVVNVDLPFNFQKSERLVWLFMGVGYYEERSKTRYVGGSQGVSVRVAKGLYYRAGAFRGEPVVTSQLVQMDNGLMAVTDKHIYFAGDHKSFRVPYHKIISFRTFDDGIGIQRDAQTAKPQIFTTGDGWFTYNLVTILAKFD